MVKDELLHLFVRHGVNRFVRSDVVHAAEVFNKLVCAEASLAFGTVNHRVREVSDVSCCLPSLVMHEDCRVKTDDIIVELGHLLPPCVLNIALKVYTKWTVIPCSCLSAINFAGLVHKTAALAKTDYFIKCASMFIFLFCHKNNSLDHLIWNDKAYNNSGNCTTKSNA